MLSESCYKGTILQRNYRKVTIYGIFLTIEFVYCIYCTCTMLYPNPCYNEVCYKGTALYYKNASLIWASSPQNLSSGFPTKLDSNQPAQLQRLARK